MSQFLLQRVIYDSERPALDSTFRTLLFKIFNRIDTWEHLVSRVGEPSVASFEPAQYIAALDERFRNGERLYSAAYIMPTPQMGRSRKHANHLELLQVLLQGGSLEEVGSAGSLRELYSHLLAVPSFGPFLAFQYAIDLNYGPHFDFSEMEFVVAGPGAHRGVAKCFTDTAGLGADDVIRAVTESAPDMLCEHQPDFQDLWGRSLQLIDCQNLFCEVDKYARVAHPNAGPAGGPTQIKQRYRRNPAPVVLGYPPKWGLPFSARCPVKLAPDTGGETE